jgi:hypothetical protein
LVEIASQARGGQPTGSGPWRSRAILAGTLAALLALLMLTAPSRSAAACPTEPFCVTTDANGTYVLNVPPASVIAFYKPEFAALEDCVWQVAVDFGDGSPNGAYEWVASTGLTGSHTFPAPGVYTVHIDATGGIHSESGEPCPDLQIVATVTYPEPASPPVAPPPEGPSGGSPSGGPHGGSGPAIFPNVAAAPAGAVAPTFWRRCRRGVVTHRVACRRGLAIVQLARTRLPGAGTARAAGFACQLRSGSPRPVHCRRGARLVFAPLRPRG